ncbi:MAG: ATP-binding protein [Anaeroplasma sp.]
MIKTDLSFDSKAVDDYIKEIKKYFPEYDINVNNVNDFSILYEEKKNCLKCNGLNQCINSNKGCCTEFDGEAFYLSECKYKKEDKIKHSKESLIKTLYLPTKILEADFSSYYVNSESRKKIFASVSDFINDYKNNVFHKGLYLYGTFSIGKTYTLACMANEFARNNISCLLIYFPDLVVDLKNAMGTPRFEQLLNMLKSIDVLMLDDLGSENMTPWIRDEVLGPIINYRVLENKAVFISSNIQPNELKLHLAIDKAPMSVLKAERIISRLTSLVTTISMDDGERYKR